MYRDKDCNEAVERYRARFEEHKVSSKTLGWREGTQDVRFKAFVQSLPKTADSILDIGCGFGDLLTFLRQKGWKGSYIGLDIVPEFILSAKEKHRSDQRSDFFCADFMDMPFHEAVDVTFSSGVFNYKREDNIQYLENSIEKARHITRMYTAFDMLSATADRRAENLFFFDSAEVLKIGLKQTKRCAIDHTYMPFEFMLKLFWDQSFSLNWPVFSDDSK